MWPDGLQVLAFEGDFDQPIHVTPLPQGLQTLTLGELFDQPLENVAWPKGLKEVSFAWYFTGRLSPRLADVVWPSGLRKMRAPEEVDMGELPEGCRRLPANVWLPANFALGFDWLMWEQFLDSD